MNTTEKLPGFFIAFEGGDGAGKTTQLIFLAEALRSAGKTVVTTREPGGTDLGEKIRGLLLSAPGTVMDARTEALLFAAARAQHVSELIRPALEAGSVVLSDRFVDSSIAYQGAGRDLGLQTVRQLNDWATEELVTDLTVLLDADAGLAARRRNVRNNHDEGSDRIEAESDVFHSDLIDAFRTIAAAEPDRYLVLAADADPQELAAKILTAVQERME